MARDFYHVNTLCSHSSQLVADQSIPSFVADMDTPLNVQLWHDSSFPFTDYLLGEATISVRDALARTHEGDERKFSLELTRSSKTLSAPVLSGSLSLSVVPVDSPTAVNGALATAKRSISNGGLHVATAEALDSACTLPATVILADGTRLLQAVLMKLETFVGIMDQASKVRYNPGYLRRI